MGSILIGPDNFVTAVDQFMGPFYSNIRSTTKKLAIFFDQFMSFDHQVTELIQPCFLHLRNIAKIRWYSADLKLLIHFHFPPISIIVIPSLCASVKPL